MTPEIERAIENLKKRHYDVSWFETGREAAEYIASGISGKTIGFGDSETMASMGLYALLSENNTVYDPMNPQPGETFYTTARNTILTDVFFTSVNGLAETGEMVNIDGTGNRVAGSLYGHEKVWFIISANKIAPTLDDAIYRARNVAAPQNSARHGFRNPCAIKGDRCYDCDAPDRICNAMTIYYRRMRFTEAEVVLIGESLGL